MGPEALQNLTRAYAPMLRAADASAWLGRWAAAMPIFPMAQAAAGEGGASAPNARVDVRPRGAAMFTPPAGRARQTDAASQAATRRCIVFAPWMAALPVMPGRLARTPEAARRQPACSRCRRCSRRGSTSMARMSGASPQGLVAFDRTFGGLFDALGFGPMRKLQAACAGPRRREPGAEPGARGLRDARAGRVRRRSRGPDARGWPKMADDGERVDSVLALLRLWAVSTEQAVHEVLQSEERAGGDRGAGARRRHASPQDCSTSPASSRTRSTWRPAASSTKPIAKSRS